MILKVSIIGFLCFFFVEAFEGETCQPRPGPQNGQVSYTVRGGGLVARYRCQSGYKLIGSPFGICLSGIWRPNVPICQLESEGDNQNNVNVSSFYEHSIRIREKDEKYDQNDAPSALNFAVDKPAKANSKKKGGKKNKGKRIAKEKKGKGTEGQILERSSEFLSKLDLSCLIGKAGTGFIKAPETPHAVIKYSRKRNEEPPMNRYLLATYECAKGYLLKNEKNDRMFCSKSRWIGPKPKCLKIKGKSKVNGTEGLCNADRGGCEHICTEVRRKVVCSCYQGFRSEGNRCLDVDECEINNGGCEHTCTNQPGSFTCQCPTGLQLSSNGKTCVDINECLPRNGHGPCQDRCTNHWGGYQCSCEGILGTQLSEDKHTCEKVDFCKSGSAGCSHSCINALGRAFCLCPVGLELGEDWKTCQDIDECDDEVIENSCEFGCINTIGSYYCAKEETENDIQLVAKDLKTLVTCSPGYQTDEEGRCVDIDECKENTHNCSHECINRQGSYECSCPNGYDLNDDEKTCEDFDECTDETEFNCTQICVNTIGSHHCECRNGYQLHDDTFSCIDIDECQLNICSHNCTNEIGGYSCFCPDGMELVNNTVCVDIDECLHQNNNCSHECINLSGTYECGCPTGMVISNDSKNCNDLNECDYNNGNCSQLCKNEVGSYECECLAGYILKNETECEDIDECSLQTLNHCSYECRNTPGSYVCYCPVGYILGVHDCEDIDECLDFNGNCSHLCINGQGSYKCDCPPGFLLTGDNRTCEDVNECLIDNGNCSHLCVNKNGSYECDCPSGYRLRDQYACDDVNECEDYNGLDGRCSDYCINFPGGYRCDCPEGYHISADNRTCIDLDECANNNGNCSHECVNTDGSFTCKCPENFDLNDTNNTCIMKNPCETENKCSHLCSVIDGKSKCSCRDGFVLQPDGKTCQKQKDCSICEQDCTITSDGIVCSCKKGYTLLEGTKCIDMDECANNPCSQLCRNTVGSYECDCYEGYRIGDANESQCMDIDECKEWEYEADYYDNEVGGNMYSDYGQLCSHLCVNVPGGFYCDCHEGYVLSEDDRTCVDENECSKDNGGCSHVCENFNGGHKCLCSNGYVLDVDNRTCIDVNECLTNNGNCSHGCENESGSFRCYCPENYLLDTKGRNCQRDCSLNNGLCSHECVSITGTTVCLCPDGYTLGNDNATCEDINECEINNGGCSHLCANTMGSYRCSCRDGHNLLDHDCILIDRCGDGNGGCSHTCEMEGDAIKCGCPDGFELDDDNQTCICPSGYIQLEDSCWDVDECEVANGGCSHECINSIGSFRCHCPAGYELHSEKFCFDINECEMQDGICPQICINEIGGYRCECFEGYKWLGNACVKDDPCKRNNGGCEQICHNVEGKANCSCWSGYVSNGEYCTDIDECQGDHGCLHHCINTVGSYECECQPGYRKVGKNCEDIDECVTLKPCSSECVNTVGSYKCLCKTGYIEKNGKCVDVNECEFENGGCSHNCLNTAGSFKCLCPHGYKVQNQTCVDIDECQIDNGGCEHICINTNGSYHCSCKQHHYLLEDKQSCQVHGKFCNSLIAPQFGEVKCPQLPNLAAEFPPGSECYVKCYKGYKLDGDAFRTCNLDGQWTGRNGECIPLPCPKLKPPENGHFIPSSCTTGKSPPSHHCILACHKGYHVQGRAVLTCLNSQQWNRPVPKCGKDTPPPFIHCPPDIKTELPSNKFSVYIKFPQPKSNVDWWSYVESHPTWAKRLEGDFQIGITTIMFHARSPVSNLTAACRFQVHVYDNEKPQVSYCPESFEVKITEKETSKQITWKEPEFTDNIRIDHIFKSREPGSSFNVGRHNIRYVATDPSGNQAICTFSITVQDTNTDASKMHPSLKLGRNFFKKLIVCPHLVAEAELMPSYLVSTRCFVQRHRLTRVLTEYPVQGHQHHRVRHNHNRLLPSDHLTTSYPGRRELMKDEPERPTLDLGPEDANEDEKVTTRSTDIILKITGGLLDNSTITVDTHSLIEQKSRNTDLARMSTIVDEYSQAHRSAADSHPGDDVRLVEYERRRQEDEERMRRHEIEMRKWREEMRRYHLEIKRLQEDSRRYRAG